MDFYALTPPNSATLSDNVIGSVVQRTWAARSRKEELPFCKQLPQRETPYTPEKGLSARDDVAPTQTTLTLALKLMEQMGSPKGRKRQSVRPSDVETANQIVSIIQATQYPISVALQAAVVVEALKKKIRHRERSRVNQARCRQRQLKVKTDIQDEISKLQAEIKELELRGQDPSRLPTTPTIWVLAAEYFRHFRHFLSYPATLHATTADFLRGMLSPDVVGAASFGVEAQIESWRLYALYFGEAELKLEGISSPTPDTLVASTTTSVTLTSNTLRYAFPYLNSDGSGGIQGGVWSPLAARILGQKLVMHGSVTFGWDDSSDKVMRLESRADLLSPMLKLLGSLEDVCSVFDNAMITPTCQFVRRQ